MMYRLYQYTGQHHSTASHTRHHTSTREVYKKTKNKVQQSTEIHKNKIKNERDESSKISKTKGRY